MNRNKWVWQISSLSVLLSVTEWDVAGRFLSLDVNNSVENLAHITLVFLQVLFEWKAYLSMLLKNDQFLSTISLIKHAQNAQS